jgi:hypothetical protein
VEGEDDSDDGGELSGADGWHAEGCSRRGECVKRGEDNCSVIIRWNLIDRHRGCPRSEANDGEERVIENPGTYGEHD